MKRAEVTLLVIGLMLASCFGYGAENSYNSDIVSGKLHLQGKVIAGACRVTSDNDDMHVELGRYDKTSSPTNVPFTVKLADCQSEIISGINIHFSGEAKSEMPNLFLSHSPKNSAKKAGQRDNPGLLILDAEGKQMLPDSAPVVVRQEKGKDTELHYFARYFATSLQRNPGELHSEVRLDIAYP